MNRRQWIRLRDQGSPDYARREPLPLAQLAVEDSLRRMFVDGTSVQAYRLGECSVIRTWHGEDRWRLSVSHPSRYPNWDEIAEARYRLIPGDVWMALVLPPKNEYVNIHPNCFQLTQIRPT